MATYLLALSTWLHVLATIVMIGYFIFTSLIFLPVFERQIPVNDLRTLLEEISARLKPFFGGSLLIFVVTGAYLMLINENYLGLGKFFSNSWSILMVLKHVLLIPFLALAVFSERAYLPKISDQTPRALQKFHLALYINTILGMVILLLTAFVQAG